MVDKTKFHNAQNAYYTKGLFIDLKGSEDENCLYTLKNEDVGQYISLYRVYIEEADLTEYSFANKYFENLEHWDLLCSRPWFQPYVRTWRKELKLKLESDILKAVWEEARDLKSKNRFSANKLLYDRLQKLNAAIRGRPSKVDVDVEIKRQTHAERTLAEDMRRVLGNDA